MNPRANRDLSASRPTQPPHRLALREDQAVWIALLNNAAFREAMSDVGLAEADILQAKTLPNPTLAMMFPAGPKPLEFAVKYPVEAIWLRPKRLEIAKLMLISHYKHLQD